MISAKKRVRKTFAWLLCVILLFNIVNMPIKALDEPVTQNVETINVAPPQESQAALALSEYTFDNIPEKLLTDIMSGVDDRSEPNSTYGLNSTTTQAEPTVVGLSTDYAEDLTSLTIINSDGSKTLHKYFEDIKFVDTDGKIRFKDNAIYVSDTNISLFKDYAFENGVNDVKTFFPEKISDGLKLETESLELTMKPVTDNDDTLQESEATLTNLSNNEEWVQYDDVFGDGTALQYIPTGKGFKENIVFDFHPGKYEFSFEINTNGLVPASSEGTSIPLLEPETNKEVALLYPVDMKDSSSNPKITLDNSMRLQATDVSGIYILTVVLNRDFLDDPDTVYPVIVDPTVSTEVNNAQSATVTSDGSNFPNMTTIGKTASGTNYCYIKTDSMTSYAYINPEKITSAYYEAFDYSGNEAVGYIEVYNSPFTTPANQVTYNMCHEIVSDHNYKHSLYNDSTGVWLEIPIKDLVVEWIEGEYNANYPAGEEYGFILSYSSQASTSYKAFFPPGTTTYPPKITINYNEDTTLQDGLYYIKNEMTGKYATAETGTPTVNGIEDNVIASTFSGALNQLWCVEYVSDGWYKIRNMHSFAQPMYLSRWGSNAKYSVDSNNDLVKFRVVKNSSSTTYRIFAKHDINTVYAMTLANVPSEITVYHKNICFYDLHGDTNQRWIFEPIEYSATVKDFYDNGMLTRWSMTDAQMQNGIKYWQDIAKEFYSSQLNIDITFSNPTKFASLADTCGYSSISALDSHCAHSDINHNSVDKNKDNFLASHSHSPKNTYVQWTGHVTYRDNAWLNDVGIHYGTTPSNNLHQGGYAMMRDLGVHRENGGSPTTTFTSDSMRAKRTYLHELAHAFGAVDSYCGKEPEESGTCDNAGCITCYPGQGYSSDCIMASLQAPNMGDDMSTWLCNKCKEDISEYITTYYHQVH